MAMLAGCDTVTDRYRTLADARDDRVFERGWLPDILPQSARDIRISDDLDVNTSEGEFSLNPSDIEPFLRRLAPFQDDKPEHASTVRRWRGMGYVVGLYAGREEYWLFACSKAEARCGYRLSIDYGCDQPKKFSCR